MALTDLYPDIVSGVPSVIPFEYGMEQRALITEFENGAEQRRVIDGSPKRYIKINYSNMTYSDANTITTFYRAVDGPLTSFRFVFPNNKTVADEYAGSATYTGQTQLYMPSRYATGYTLKKNGIVVSPSAYTFYVYPYDSISDLVSLNVGATLGDKFHWTFTGRLVIKARFASGPVNFADVKDFYSSAIINLVSVSNSVS